MDIFIPILICVIFCILFSICGWCCKRKREGTIYGFGVPNTTVQITQSPQVVPPYPVHTGSATNGPPYPTNTPYPPHVPPTGGAVPYVPPGSAPTFPNINPHPVPPAPNPPYPINEYGVQQPPSYYEAVSQPPPPPVVPAPLNEVYAKQAPYNPNY